VDGSDCAAAGELVTAPAMSAEAIATRTRLRTGRSPAIAHFTARGIKFQSSVPLELSGYPSTNEKNGQTTTDSLTIIMVGNWGYPAFGTNASARRGLSTRMVWSVASSTPACFKRGTMVVMTMEMPGPPFFRRYF
jgi:hypothetical protein